MKNVALFVVVGLTAVNAFAVSDRNKELYVRCQENVRNFETSDANRAGLQAFCAASVLEVQAFQRFFNQDDIIALKLDTFLAHLVDNIDLADRMNNYLAPLLLKLVQTNIGSSEFEATFASIQNFFEASIIDAAELDMISKEQIIQYKIVLEQLLLQIRQRLIEAKIQSQTKTK